MVNLDFHSLESEGTEIKMPGDGGEPTSEFPVFEAAHEAKRFLARLTRRRKTLDGLIFAVRNLVSNDAVQIIRANALSMIEDTAGGWARLERGTPDFWWTNDNNPQSTVKGFFTQVNFFPWNPRGSTILEIVRPVFQLRDEIHRVMVEPSVTNIEESFNRVAIQIYPKGGGWLQPHEDPRGSHQTLVASVVLSHFGSDYSHGGLFVKSRSGALNFVERALKPGDVLFFDPTVIHGVDTIDPSPNTHDDCISPITTGRWMALCTTNLTDRADGKGTATPVTD